MLVGSSCLSSTTSCWCSCAFQLEMHISAVFLLGSWKLLTPLGSWRNPSAEAGARRASDLSAPVFYHQICPSSQGVLAEQLLPHDLTDRGPSMPRYGYRLQPTICVWLCWRGKKNNQPYVYIMCIIYIYTCNVHVLTWWLSSLKCCWANPHRMQLWLITTVIFFFNAVGTVFC